MIDLFCGIIGLAVGSVLWRESSKRPKGWKAALLRLVAIFALLVGIAYVISILYRLSQ